MSKHTPGPWFINLESEDCGKWKLSVEAEGLFIAQVDECLEQEANACLIAAAPDLFEAAQLCRQWMYEHASNTDDNAFEKLCAAIAKAAGE